MRSDLTPEARELLLSLQVSFRLLAVPEVHASALVLRGLAVNDGGFLVITDLGVLAAKQLLAERALAERVFRASNGGDV